jgi:tetratricopeptide (TPR) repeat protein
VTALCRLGQAESELGNLEAGERTLREAVAIAKRIGVPFAVRQAELHLAALLCKFGDDKNPSSERRAEGRAIAEAVLGAPGVSTGYQGWARGLLAQAMLADGALDEAERQARAAVDLCASVPLRKLWVRVLLVRSLIHLNRVAEAQALAAELPVEIERLGGAGYVEIDARLATVEAYEAAGDREAAKAALREALQKLRLGADSIPEPAWRERYLEGVTENARVLTLAREWLAGELHPRAFL